MSLMKEDKRNKVPIILKEEWALGHKLLLVG